LGGLRCISKQNAGQDTVGRAAVHIKTKCRPRHSWEGCGAYQNKMQAKTQLRGLRCVLKQNAGQDTIKRAAVHIETICRTRHEEQAKPWQQQTSYVKEIVRAISYHIP